MTNEVRNLGLLTMSDMLARLPVEVDRRSKLREAVRRAISPEIPVMTTERLDRMLDGIVAAVERWEVQP